MRKHTAKNVLDARLERDGLKGILGDRIERSVLKAMEEYAQPKAIPVLAGSSYIQRQSSQTSGRKIGIAITTVPERMDMHRIQMEHIARFTPDDVFIYVHNDHRKIGIARSKNNCIAMLMQVGCTDLILLDDDVYPVREGWMDSLIRPGLAHICPTYTAFANGAPSGHKVLKTVDGVEHMSFPCGFILYYTRECIERIGGMDIRYGKYGYEHVGLSSRIKNTGMIPHPFLNPIGVLEYFHIEDWYKEDFHQEPNKAIYRKQEREKYVKIGEPIFNEEKVDASWKPYEQSDYVLTPFYTTVNDSQRNTRMVPDTRLIETLIKSAPCPVVLFTDMTCPRKPAFKFVFSKPQNKIDLYNYRFIEYLKWLKINREYCNTIYLLDATDTEFIGEKHVIEPNTVYINTEGEGGSLSWLMQKASFLRNRDGHLLRMRGNDLWNCGVIYGHVDAVIKLLECMLPYMKFPQEMDMPALNYLCNRGIPGLNIVPVKSGFKQPDKTGVYIRHK